MIVEESLEDNRVLNDFHIINVRITDENNHAERWHVYKVETTKEQLQNFAPVLKPEWYAHFGCGDEMIVLFRDKMFAQKTNDKNTWQPAIEHGLSLGIPKSQLDFLI